MDEIYLTRNLKKKYMLDFENKVLTCEDKFWKLDEGVKEILIEINRNSNIQSLYSKWGKFRDGFTVDNSYITICYKKELELEIFRNCIPIFIAKFNPSLKTMRLSRPRSQFSYLFASPEIQEIESEGSCEFGHFTDPYYWNVNNIKFELESSDKNEHEKFWNEIKNQFSNLI